MLSLNFLCVFFIFFFSHIFFAESLQKSKSKALSMGLDLKMYFCWLHIQWKGALIAFSDHRLRTIISQKVYYKLFIKTKKIGCARRARVAIPVFLYFFQDNWRIFKIIFKIFKFSVWLRNQWYLLDPSSSLIWSNRRFSSIRCTSKLQLSSFQIA
jgi:hypothetical protein